MTIAFDAHGDLYVANAGDAINEFVPTSTVPTAGGVVIQSSVESRPISIGGTNNAAVAGINLTNVELAQIFTTSTGTLTIGDSQQTRNITFSTAAPTQAGERRRHSVDICSGQIIFDHSAGAGMALIGNGKHLVTAGTGGIVELANNTLGTPDISTTSASVMLATTGPIGTRASSHSIR